MQILIYYFLSCYEVTSRILNFEFLNWKITISNLNNYQDDIFFKKLSPSSFLLSLFNITQLEYESKMNRPLFHSSKVHRVSKDF